MADLSLPYSHDDIEEITDGFCEENYIGKFQFGKVYYGIVWEDEDEDERVEVVVKIWEDNSIYEVRPGDNRSRLSDEVQLFQHFGEDAHPNLPKLFGYFQEGERFGCLYEVKPLDALNNLIPKDSFSWPERIKVAVGFASILDFMHSHNPPHLIRNIDAAHIIIDVDHNPLLFDFSMISGGVLTDKKDILNQYVFGCYGYIDPSCIKGGWTEKCDVFAYGVVLLGLISKRVYTDEDRTDLRPFVYEWANSEYESGKKSSLVHKSLESGLFFHPADGVKITKLALQCVDHNPHKRPTISQVLTSLLELSIVCHHADTLGINQTAGGDAEMQKDELSGFFSDSIHKERILDKRERMTTSIDESILNEGQRMLTSIQRGKECAVVQVYSYKDLSLFTNGFREENFIGKFHFGKVYVGEIEGKMVTVKIWDSESEVYEVSSIENEGRLMDELVLLQHPELISHPNLVNLMGYCYEGQNLGVVYNLEPLDTLHNLLLKDTFTWSERIRAALEFARLLKFLHADTPHSRQYLVRNIAAAHLILDQDHNLKLFDFGMISGGIFPDRTKRREYVRGCIGYIDFELGRGSWSEASDVFSFGIVLIGLVSKRVCTEEEEASGEPFLDEWLNSQYDEKTSELGFDKTQFSIVHESLKGDPGFCSNDGVAITKLAMQCVKGKFDRPTMKQVVKQLLNLSIVRNNMQVPKRLANAT
ncbi:hypothetical protein SLE2022_049950 [Rubroshorea leprosula]